MQNSTVEERVLEPIASGEEIAWLMFEFQIYTIVAWSLQVLQERKLTTESLVYLGHHAFTFVLAGAGIRYTFNHCKRLLFRVPVLPAFPQLSNTCTSHAAPHTRIS